MAIEICQDMNPNCIVITCCTKPCDSLKWRIESKLMGIGSRDLFNFYITHILNKQTCPRCNREEIYPVIYNRYSIECSFCKRIFVFEATHTNRWGISKKFSTNNWGISHVHPHNRMTSSLFPSTWEVLAHNIIKGNYIDEHMRRI